MWCGDPASGRGIDRAQNGRLTDDTEFTPAAGLDDCGRGPDGPVAGGADGRGVACLRCGRTPRRANCARSYAPWTCDRSRNIFCRGAGGLSTRLCAWGVEPASRRSFARRPLVGDHDGDHGISDISHRCLCDQGLQHASRFSRSADPIRILDPASGHMGRAEYGFLAGIFSPFTSRWNF